ncbi:virion phosphoprotein early morphogenesis [Western grey kangaroopox virus]|uniref:Assembly protein G7 n=1 Tax=Western grey kangaroopox virus TaxID=1566307 RepID=A0A2C9DSL8_9POXV|nr:virion phosphoprotein early morphogenesis [Western grey kangaroopox virus]ATI21001.1 virion phosphoprotein early morphogenesis [Western grey kangaroopox virus]
MTEQRQSALYNIVARAVVDALLNGLVEDLEYIVGKARYLCYASNHARREAAVNSIYLKCESDLAIPSIEKLRELLGRIGRRSRYVHNEAEFLNLYCSLVRFTHSQSFFRVCAPTIVATAATMVTLLLANQLAYAAEMVEEIEAYLFESADKGVARELADLLDTKYGLINLAQYRIFPIFVGREAARAAETAQEPTAAGAPAVARTYHEEVSALLYLPLRSEKIDEMYKYLAEHGMFVNNYAEYVAGLKIQEIGTDGRPVSNQSPSSALAAPERAHAVLTAAEGRIREAVKREAGRGGLLGNVADRARTALAERKLLDAAERYSRGHVLDGAVLSPVTEPRERDRIHLSMSDINKFIILDYLYTIRMLVNCVRQKNEVRHTKKSAGVTLSINSPFKIITIPGK